MEKIIQQNKRVNSAAFSNRDFSFYFFLKFYSQKKIMIIFLINDKNNIFDFFPSVYFAQHLKMGE